MVRLERQVQKEKWKTRCEACVQSSHEHNGPQCSHAGCLFHNSAPGVPPGMSLAQTGRRLHRTLLCAICSLNAP